MTAYSWRLSLSVQAHDTEREMSVPVVAGLVDTEAGGVQVALQVGDDRPVILAIQDARQLATNVTDAITQRLKITVEHLRDNEQGQGQGQP